MSSFVLESPSLITGKRPPGPCVPFPPNSINRSSKHPLIDQALEGLAFRVLYHPAHALNPASLNPWKVAFIT